MATDTGERERLDPGLLAGRLEPDHRELRARVRDVLQRPEFTPVTALTTPSTAGA